MLRNIYKYLLYALRSLIYLKRALLFGFSQVGRLFSRISKLYRNTFGFRIYKIRIAIGRVLKDLNLHAGGRFFAVLKRRSALQLLLVVVGFVIMFPHSALYTKEDSVSSIIPGRNTVLYALVGPGDYSFEIEEIVVDVTEFVPQDTRSWSEGAVVSEQAPKSSAVSYLSEEGISSISAGGLALTKPTIISGAEISVLTTSQTEERQEAIEHIVRPGEVIGSIAQKYDISVATILWANDLSVRSYIRPGDRLTILPINGVVHTVARGDTVTEIANKYAGDVSKIVSFNKLQKDGADIIVGEDLIIPDGEKPQATRTLVHNTPAPSPQRKYTGLNDVAAPPPSVSAPAGSGYLWPTSVRTITQYYGWRHTGVDIAGPVGTPLFASKSGSVIRSQCGWNGGYGCYIILDHGNGVQTLYAHASQLYVGVGEHVVQGQTIAAMGSTGRSTGPHIHYEVRVNGSRTNPFQYVR